MFELYRMTPHGYRLALEGKYYDDEDLAYEGNVGKQWDILRRMLATGSYPTLRWPQAICGGNALRPEDDYDGVRVLSPDQLAEISREHAFECVHAFYAAAAAMFCAPTAFGDLMISSGPPSGSGTDGTDPVIG